MLPNSYTAPGHHYGAESLPHLSSQLPSVPSLLNGKFGGGSMFFLGKKMGGEWWLNHAVVENNKSTFDTIRMTKLVIEPAAPHVGAGVRPNNRGDLSPFAARKKVCFLARSFVGVLFARRFGGGSVQPALAKDPTRDRNRRHHPRGDCGNPGRYTLSVDPGAPIWSGLCGHPLAQNHGGTDTNCGAARQHFE